MDSIMISKKIKNIIVGSIQTNCWIYMMSDSLGSPQYSAPKGTIPCTVIDPGADAPVIINYLKKHNLYPVYILLTHGHFDHVTAMPDLLKAFQKDESETPFTAMHREDAPFMKTKPDRFLYEGDTIGPFSVIHVPGHTPGSAAFFDEKEDILFTGDTLFCADCGRTDLAGGNPAKLEKSLERLLAMKADIRVLPGHGSETTIGEEAKRGLPFFMG